MKFGIIIPTYNRARVLPRAIRSVLDQDYPDWALYVVNDGSGDETESVVRPFLSDSRIRYLSSSVNRGRLHSLNLALDRVETEGIDWFTWMDDDDRLTENCLSVARARPFFVLLALFASWAAGAMVWNAKHVSGRQDPLRAVSASSRGRVLV